MKTDLLLIVDESGSMEAMRRDVEGGINNLLAEQRAIEGECRVTIVTFGGDARFGAINPVRTLANAQLVQDIGTFRLVPRGGTPLLDAVGTTVQDASNRWFRSCGCQTTDKAVVVIVTDGEENTSRTWNKRQVKELLEHLQGKHDVQVVFLGANVDAFAEAGGIGLAAASASNFTLTSAGAALSLTSRKVGDYRRGMSSSVAYSAQEQDLLAKS